MNTANSPEKYDVAIIGGGPAGCSSAIHLAKQGIKVILCEAKTYPHHKVCGEFLSPECHRELACLDLMNSIYALQPIPIDDVQIIAPDGTVWHSKFPSIALGLSRYNLDYAMVQQASAVGVTVRQGTTITAVSGNLTEGFVLTGRSHHSPVTIQARLVVTAHGKRSGLDRGLKRQFLQHQRRFIGLKAHFHGPAMPRSIRLYTFQGGYCGMSEVETGAINVCLLVEEAILKQASRANADTSANLDTFISWMQSQNTALQHWFRQAERILPDFEQWLSISQVIFSPKESVLNDMLMVGDAAGLIPPLAGDGIAMALHSGRMAAEYASKFLNDQVSATSLCQLYATRWQQAFSGRLRLGRLLQAFMLRPSLLSPSLKVLTAFPALGNYLMLHTRDSHYRASNTLSGSHE